MLTVKTPYCPSQEDLADFAAGTVTAERLETLSAHIDTCVVCQATIAELSNSADSFVATLRTSQGVIEEESACRQALEQMLNQRGRVAASPKPSVSLPEFVGPYRVLEPIAAGGMGMVLRAQHPKLKRTVAIKLLPLQQWAGSTAVARFEREMEVIGNLDHPNIVRASDAGDAGGMHYLVMDFIDGTDLSQLVHRLGPLPVADACEIARQTAIGLQYVHDAGLVHRDIKPSNIMLTGDGRVKILDLGLAMLNEQFSEDANNLTTVGQLMGTLDYMSPEQAADSRQVDARADIYSLGATLFKLLTGQAPYGGPTHRSLLKKVLALASGPVPSVRAIRADVPIELDQIVQRCLDKNIESRFTRVAEVAEALAPLAATAQLSALAHEAAQRAHRDPAETPSWNWVPQDVDQPSESAAQEAKPLPKSAKPRKLITAIVGVAALALLIAGGVLIRIATDRGELIVRSDDPHAQIRITRVADQSVEDIAVEKGEKRTVVKSGEYSVELLGDGDDWTLSPTRFTMQRGGQKVLQVQRGPLPSESSDAAGLMGAGGMGMPGMSSAGMGSAGMGMPGMGGMPGGSGGGSGMGGMMGGGGSAGVGPAWDGNSYNMSPANQRPNSRDGKTYDEWMLLLETERRPDRLEDAVEEIKVLMPKGDDERVARAYLSLMRDFGSFRYEVKDDDNSQSADQRLCKTSCNKLRGLDAHKVCQAIMAELPQMNHRAADFASQYFIWGLRITDKQMRWRNAIQSHAPDLLAGILAASGKGEANADSIALLTLAAVLCTNFDVDVSWIDGFLPRFHQALQSDNNEEALVGACVLVHYEPDTEGIAKVLVRMGFGQHGPLDAPLNLLMKLGPRAESVVPGLVDELLNPLAHDDQTRSSWSRYERPLFLHAVLGVLPEASIQCLESIREKASPEQSAVIESLIQWIKIPLAQRGLFPHPEGSMMPGARSMPLTMRGVLKGHWPGPGTGSMMPNSGGGSMMPDAGSMTPGSGLPSTTVDAAPADAENEETPGTSDGTSQAPANALPGGLLGSGAGLPGALPGESGGTGAQSLYDGKSYEQWMSLLETERSPGRLLEAVEAIKVLVPKGDDERVAGALLQLMRIFGEFSFNTEDPRGKLIGETKNLLLDLNTQSVCLAILSELSQMNSREADFLSHYFTAGLGRSVRTWSAGAQDNWRNTIQKAAPDLLTGLLAASAKTETNADSIALLTLAAVLCTSLEVDVSKIEGFLARYHQALRSENDDEALAGACILVQYEPDTKGIAEVVVRMGHRRSGPLGSPVNLLEKLGPRAESVVPSLVDDLLNNSSDASSNDRRFFAQRALRSIGEPAIPYLQARTDRVDSRQASIIASVLSQIQARHNPSYNTMPGPGSIMMPGAGSMMPGSGGSMMPGSGSLLPGSNLPSTTVPGEDASPSDAKNEETPGTSDGTSQAPANALPGGLLGNGEGLPGALPGETGVFNGGIDTKEKYDGKSFEEWMAILETERSPDRLMEVFEAIQVVRPKGEDERVARAILRCMRDWERPQADGPNRKYMYGARSLIQFLDPVSVLQVIRSEIPHLNNRQANFLSLYFHTGFGESSDYAIPPGVTRNRWCRIVKDGAPTLVVEALEQSRQTDDSVDTTAMLVIAETLSTLAGLDVTKIDGFLPRFREALRSNDDRAVLAAASVMVIHEPDTEGLAEIVGRFLENDADRGRACQLLLRLGPRAEPVVSRLIDQLLHTQDPPDQYRLASTIALLLDDTVTSAMEAAARESSVESAVSRLALVRQLAKQLSPVEPYGTIPEWNRTQDTATPTEAAPPQESDRATPNADVKKLDEAEAGGNSNTPSPSADKDSQ